MTKVTNVRIAVWDSWLIMVNEGKVFIEDNLKLTDKRRIRHVLHVPATTLRAIDNSSIVK